MTETVSLLPHTAILAAFLVAGAAAVQGTVGFGMALLSAPLLVLLDPLYVPGPIIAAALALTTLIALRDRSAMDVHGMGWALAGRVLGTTLALAVLGALDPGTFGVFFGVLVICAVGISAAGFSLRPTPRITFAAGALSGFMGTASSIGGPPMALVYQRSNGKKLRGTLSGYFAVGAAISLVALAAVHRFGLPEMERSLVLVPAAVAGYLLSCRTAPALDRLSVRPAVLVLSGVAALAVLLRAVV